MRRAFGNRKQSPIMSRRNSKEEGYSMLFIVLVLTAIVLLTTGGCYYYKPELFGNLLGGQKIKDLDVLFFMNPTCPWCKKMVAVMNKENTLNDVMVVDVSKPEGQELAKKYGAASRGVPSFISRKLNTGTVGYKDSTKKVVSGLVEGQKPVKQLEQPEQPQPGAVSPEVVKDLGIVMFVSEGCGWCKKAKEEAVQNGVMPYLELQDIGTPEGKATLNELIGEGNFKGAPTFYCRKTGKTAVGYMPMDKIVMAVQ